MSALTSFLNKLLNFPVKALVRSKVIPETPLEELQIDSQVPVFYVMGTESSSDIIALKKACKQYNLPKPTKAVDIANTEQPRVLFLSKPAPVFGSKSKPTTALSQGQILLTLLKKNPDQQAILIPVSIVWGRSPGKEKASVQQIIDDAESPSWLRKASTVIFSGRDNLIRFSQPVSLRDLVDNNGDDKKAAKKLLRVARFHFYRQKLAATGPRMVNRTQMFNSLLATPALKKAVADEAKSKKISTSEARKNAISLLDEVAADYRDSYIRIGDRFLTWLWNKLYRGIEVNNVGKVRELAENGHEIVYIPCHRSHMDYMLLTYVIYKEGLVPPRIAAGINLNFWPAGPIFRKCGAFFIRRSFKGNKLYSAVFREYLSQLFSKGYSVKYYTEGGRSRTGLLLPPKTGMIAMTLQSMLRGIDRPVTIVPVYLGYEHVMEVSTYLKELKGKTKKNESISGVVKAIRSLRNYGHGYVNFGEPVQVNQFLNEHAPDWKSYIDPIEPEKPKWLTPTINVLANEVMTGINNAAALNSVNLTSLILLSAEKHSLTRSELATQLSLYANIQKHVPYSTQVSMPEEKAEELIDHIIEMKKVEVTSDSLGDIISLSDKEQVLMNYYRNNIIHLYAIPSLIASVVISNNSIKQSTVEDIVQTLFPLFKNEWFLNEQCPAQYTLNMIEFMVEQQLICRTDDSLGIPKRQSNQYFQLQLLANCVDLILQRYAIVFNTITDKQPLARRELESQSLALAERLSSMHGIHSPEFYDKKVLSALTTAMKNNDFIDVNSEGQFEASDKLVTITEQITGLLRTEVIQSIKQA